MREQQIETSLVDQLLTPTDAAKILGLSADTVRFLANNGRLPTLRTPSGRRLFRRSDVETLKELRAGSRRKRPAARPGRH